MSGTDVLLIEAEHGPVRRWPATSFRVGDLVVLPDDLDLTVYEPMGRESGPAGTLTLVLKPAEHEGEAGVELCLPRGTQLFAERMLRLLKATCTLGDCGSTQELVVDYAKVGPAEIKVFVCRKH